MPLEQGESKMDFSCISPKFLVHFVTDFFLGTPEPSSSSTHSSLAFESWAHGFAFSIAIPCYLGLTVSSGSSSQNSVAGRIRKKTGQNRHSFSAVGDWHLGVCIHACSLLLPDSGYDLQLEQYLWMKLQEHCQKKTEWMNVEKFACLF